MGPGLGLEDGDGAVVRVQIQIQNQVRVAVACLFPVGHFPFVVCCIKSRRCRSTSLFFHFSEFLIPCTRPRRGGLLTGPGKHRQNQRYIHFKNIICNSQRS